MSVIIRECNGTPDPNREPCKPHEHDFPQRPQMDSPCAKCGMLFEWYINVECD